MRKAIENKDRNTTHSRGERIRFLNVIYFVDSHRTRSLKFTLKRATITVVVLLSLLSWSFIASGLLIHEYAVNSELRAHSRSLLGGIFNYQTRFDEVYENAYPSGSVPLVAQSDAASGEDGAEDKNAPPTELIVDNSDDAISQLTDKGASKTASPPAKGFSMAAKSFEGDKDVPIDIENFSKILVQNTLIVRFALKNLATKTKTSGTVKARAQFADAQGKTSFIEMREGDTDEEGEGDTADSSSGQHFNIRYYKNKIFRFDSPTGKDGRFASVEVTLKDETGRTKIFNFPIDQSQTVPVPHSAPVAKKAETKGSDGPTETQETPNSADAAPAGAAKDEAVESSDEQKLQESANDTP